VTQRNHHATVWLTIATILAGFPLSAHAQYPVGPGDNGNGVTPMAPLSASSVPQYGNSGGVPNAPYNPTTSSRPANWVGGSAPTTPPDNPSQPSPQYPATPGYPQTNAPPTPLQWASPAAPSSNPPGGTPSYPSTAANSFGAAVNPLLNPPENPGAAPPGGIDPGPVGHEMLNLTGNPQIIPNTVVLARVGSEGIFAGEVTPEVDRQLAMFKAKMSPEDFELSREQFPIQRELLIKRSLISHIQSKLIFQDVRRDIPAENMGGVERSVTAEFEKRELPKLLKRENATTMKELEDKLKAAGGSLGQEKKIFMEKALVGEWVRRQIKPDEIPTVTQMTHYYETHKADFTTQAKARWEELTVSKEKYATPEEAKAAIAEMGNRVLVRGEPLADVAKQSSDGFTAIKGGARDWVSKGSLTDKEIDAALFSPTLPVGQLSQIIETPTDYNIIRIVERVDQKTDEFTDVQDKIRKKLTDERTERQFREYLERLERRTPIWTVYDGNGDGLPLTERLKDDPATIAQRQSPPRR
jgi:peptidyl-prolyl cis-trans isomerase SurA